MPKTPIDYLRTCMYKLCCNDPSIRDEYVGHTTNKAKRKQQHKTRCNNPNDEYYNFYVYQFIRNNGGFDNWSMVVIEEYPCENVNQAKLRERYWLETLQATLNKVIPMRTPKEYREEHKEELTEWFKNNYQKNKQEIKIKHQEYYEKNKEKIGEYKKQYKKNHNENYECECGGRYNLTHKSTHMKTQKHINYLNNLG